MDKPLTTRWVGLDWADKAHRLVVVDDAGTVLASWSTPHTPTGIAELVRRLRRHGPVAGIAIERKHHLVVHALVQAGFVVYPINPALSSRWGREVSVAGSKSEFADARNLADGLRLRHGRLRRLIPDDPLTRELALSCRHECQLIAEQTRHVNHLQALLKDYYPAAWGWFSDWTCPTAWDFVLTYPTPQALADATTQKLVGFLKVHHIGLRPVWQERIERHTEALAWPCDPATIAADADMAQALASLLRTLRAQLRRVRRRIDELFAQHPDAALFLSLPGAADKLAPRLLSHIGARRDRYESARELLMLSGCVPVPRESGEGHRARFRWACQKDFRNTLHHFAFASLNRSIWARAFYDRCRAKGHSDAQARRNLGEKWLKIIFRMWQTRTPYDEATYLASLIRRGSPLIEDMRST